MLAIPADIPDTTPDASISAIAIASLLQVPPGSVLVNVVVKPWQTTGTPPIDTGVWFTVTAAVVIQPVGSVYVTFVVPAELPVTRPSAEPISAIADELLLQVPSA